MHPEILDGHLEIRTLNHPSVHRAPGVAVCTPAEICEALMPALTAYLWLQKSAVTNKDSTIAQSQGPRHCTVTKTKPLHNELHQRWSALRAGPRAGTLKVLLTVADYSGGL